MIILSLITLASTYVLYNIDSHNIIYNAIERKWKKWKRMKNFLSNHHNNFTDLYKAAFDLILKAIYISLIQTMNNSVIKIDKNTYQISYVINGNLYKMISIPKKGPTSIIEIRDENDIDITEHILPYYGPCNDWHCISFIPQFFKCKKMIFELDSCTKEFNELDYIDLL